MKTTKVALRKKSISKGRKSLYLDFYPPILSPRTEKMTRREFLGLYIYERPKGNDEKKKEVKKEKPDFRIWLFFCLLNLFN